MFDVNGTRAWWNFFHRFSYILNLTQHSSTTTTNFDYILILGINLLQCQACRDDAGQFIKTIGDHKSPYEKMHILHNYVNRKLNKPIFEISDSKRLVSDVIEVTSDSQQEVVNWGKLMGYYFDLLFQIVKYIDEKQLGDLKEFSAYIYRAIDVPKRSRGLAINVEYIGKYSQELIKMQIYEYYRNVITSLNLGSTFKVDKTPTQSTLTSQSTPTPPHTLKTYQEIYGNMPKINKTCKSCAKRHALYIESHNTATATTPTSASQQKIITPIEVPQITPTYTPKSIETTKTQPQSQSKLAQNPPTKKTKVATTTPSTIPKVPASTSNNVVPSLVKLPPKLHKPAKTIKTKVEEKNAIEEIVVERTINNQTNNDQTTNQEEVAKIRKKIVIVPKAKKAVGVRKDKRKIIFQSSRIIRYQQNRVKSAK